MAKKKKSKRGVQMDMIPRRGSSTRVYDKACSCSRKSGKHHCKKSSCKKGHLQGVPRHFRCPPGFQGSKAYKDGSKPKCKSGKKPIAVASYDRCKPVPFKPGKCGKRR